MPTRRDLLRLLAAAGSATLLPGADSRNLLLLSSADAEKIRAAFADSALRPRLRKMADAALKAGPWSVTFHRPENLQLESHEYFSEGPYWWPDPNNASGPYIRRDGERNPARFNHNHDDLGAMAANTLTLGMAAYFLQDAPAVRRASQALSTWFIDPKTAMAPNLEHGQAVRGINEGRGTGLIDTVSLIHCAQGVTLLEAGGLDPAVAAGVRKWYASFAGWMTDSKKGRDEEKSGNNHATWWGAQVAAYSIFTGDKAMQEHVWQHYRTTLVNEMHADGSCPREEERTNSLSYSTMNLDAFSTLCTLAQTTGVNLWRVKNAQGAGLETAALYLQPYIQHPDMWQHRQITPFHPASIVYPGLTGAGLPSEELLKTYLSLPRAESPWVLFIDLLVRNRTS
jgi:hypothetical protein